MKRIHVFMLFMFSVLMFSCNDGNKLIKPVSNKINGPLGDYFQLVQGEFIVQDGQITIDFKRIKEGWPVPMKSNASLGDCDECYELGLMAEFMDQEGNVLAKSLADFVSAPEQMRDLIGLNLDETASVSFAVESEDVSQVKMLSDFVYHGTASVNMSGAVNGAIDILMSIVVSPQGEAQGGYYHQKFGPDAVLGLLGVLEGQDLTLDEYTIEGKRLGRFMGVFKEGSYTGIYESFDGKTYNFSLAEDMSMIPVDYTGIDFGACSDEPAYNANNQEDYEQFYQEMFESQGILLSVGDTMRLMLNKTELELAVGECDTLVLTSFHAAMPITWISSNEAVAMVGASGVVRAISVGEAIITASVQPTTRDTVTTMASITVKPARRNNSSNVPANTSNVDLGFAIYEPLPQPGMTGVKNGQPHGNGIMRFKSRHIIPGTQDCVAEAGEWVNGMWRDGKINAGTWYRNDGNQVIVKLGQRYNR